MARPLVLALALALAAAATACGGSRATPTPPRTSPDADPEGPLREAVAGVVKPYLDAELFSGLVVGLIRDGKSEIYGFGTGPGGAAPTGRTLFELGSVSKVFTGLLLADAVQRRELELDTAVAELLPAGVTVPTRDGVVMTVRHLALDSSGLPPLPPSIMMRGDARDPFAGYGEDALYRDLIQTELQTAPGVQIAFSNYGAGLLGFLLGRKIGTGYAQALATRIARPLELRDTFVTVPADATARRATGTDDDLAPTTPWTWDALAGAGGVIGSARDLVALVQAELDAYTGGKEALRAPMRLTQETQLANVGTNLGLGWVIDQSGRYWHAGTTGGFRSFVAFDPKSRHGVVLLASTATSLLDRLAPVMFDVVAGNPPKTWTAPTTAQLAAFAGAYLLDKQKLTVVAAGKRLYIEAEGEPRRRLSPVSDHEFWLDPLSAVAIFREEAGKVTSIVFGVGKQQLVARRAD